MNTPLSIPDYVQDLLSVSSRGIGSIVSKLSELLLHPVLVADPFYQVIASSTRYVDISEIVIMPSKDLEDHPQLPISLCQVSTSTALQKGLITPITLANQNLGFLVLINDTNDVDTADFQPILHFGASLCALQMQQKLEIRKEKSKLKDTFLFDLLYGNFKNKDDIIDYGVTWGWNFTVPHTVLVFSLIESDFFFTDKNKLTLLLRLVEQELLLQDLHPITIAKQNQVITLIPQQICEQDPFKDMLERFADTILSRAEKVQPALEIACGIGKSYDNPAELFRSYQEAKVAFELGLLLNMPIPFFSDLGLERILFKHDLQDLKEFYDHTLGALIAYDTAHEGNLMETLEALCANQFDIGKTAAALFLHRNTLRYRIKRMEEILNVKFDDLNVRLNITAALKIKLLRKL